MEVVNNIEITKRIQTFLNRYFGKEPDVTILVFYKEEKEAIEPFSNWHVDRHQPELCYQTLVKMIHHKENTSLAFSEDIKKDVGSVASEGMIVTMAGIDSALAVVIIAQCLFHSKLFSWENFEKLKSEIGHPDAFEKLLSKLEV